MLLPLSIMAIMATPPAIEAQGEAGFFTIETDPTSAAGAPPTKSGSNVLKDLGCINIEIEPDTGLGSPGGSLTFDLSNRRGRGCIDRVVSSLERWVLLTPGVGSVTADKLGAARHRLTVRLNDNAQMREWVAGEFEFKTCSVLGLCPLSRSVILGFNIDVPSRAADLVIASFDVEHVLNDARGNTLIRARAENRESGNVQIDFRLADRIGTEDFRTQKLCDHDSFNSSGACAYERWLTLEPGTYRFEACVDRFPLLALPPYNTGNPYAPHPKNVQETNERNNCAARHLVVPGPSADLEAVGLLPQSFPVVAGELNELAFEVANRGNADSAPAEVRFRVPGGEILGIAPIPAIAPGASRTVKHPWTPSSAGTVTLEARILVGSAPDLDPTNHDVRIEVQVDPAPALPPDLGFLPSDLWITPSAPSVGDPMTFHARVRNFGAGELPAASGMRVTLEAGNASRSFVVDEAIPADGGLSGELVLDTNWAPPEGGSYLVSVEADSTGVVFEDPDVEPNSRILFFTVDGGATSASCQGTWELTDMVTGEVLSSPGSVVDDCQVRWGQGEFVACWVTQNTVTGAVATWYRDNGSLCPTRALATVGDQEFNYTVSILP